MCLYVCYDKHLLNTAYQTKALCEGQTHKTAFRQAQTTPEPYYRQMGHREKSREPKSGLFLAKVIREEMLSFLPLKCTRVLWCL